MKKQLSRYQGYGFPSGNIGHPVWLYPRFCLSLREVEKLLAKRGITVTYETTSSRSLPRTDATARTGNAKISFI